MKLERLRDRVRGDDGVAIAIVVLGGMILVLMAVVATSRAARQVNTVSGDVRWEQALHVAESCLDVGLVALDANKDWTTGETLTLEVVGTGAERDWAIQAAEIRSAGDLVPTPEGDCMIVKPLNADLLYAVGFTPSRASDQRRMRVVRVALTAAPTTYQVTRAFVTNDDFEISGNPTFHGGSASVHTNGFVDVPGNPTIHDGCLTASDDGSVSGNLNVHSSCPVEPFLQPEIVIPEVEPRDFWHLSEYDMCPNGEVRAGPAHPVFGSQVVGSVPCQGPALETDAESNPFRGWKFTGCCDDKEWATWDYDTDTKNDGTYYFYWGTVRVPSSPGTNNNPWRMLIVAEAKNSCDSLVGGDIYVSGVMVVAPYRAGTPHVDNNFSMVAGRDLEWSGNGRLKEPGIVAATEQIEISGNPQIEGGFIAEGRCDSSDSNINETVISGNPTFTLDGPLDTIWETGPGELAVVGWDEL